MAVDEQARHELYDELQRALGPAAGAADPGLDAVDASGEGPAGTLMSYLPPVGWADMATIGALSGVEQRLDARIDSVGRRMDAKIDGVGQRLDAKIDGVEQRMALRLDSLRDQLLATFRAEMSAQTRQFIFWSFVPALTVGGLVLAATKLP